MTIPPYAWAEILKQEAPYKDSIEQHPRLYLPLPEPPSHYQEPPPKEDVQDEIRGVIIIDIITGETLEN